MSLEVSFGPPEKICIWEKISDGPIDHWVGLLWTKRRMVYCTADEMVDMPRNWIAV